MNKTMDMTRNINKPIKRVLITGGGSGLGRAMAKCWAQSGAAICIADINQQRAEKVIAELQSFAVDAFYIGCDITQTAQIESLKQIIENRWQGIDLVVNNAGVASADSLQDESIEQWQQIIEINLLGAVKVTQVFAELFRRQGFGYFLNVASQAGITPVPMMASYNASKAALVSFSETMRLELNDEQIGVSVICPGFFKTNLNESLKTTNKGLAMVLDKMMARATVTAEQVADSAFQGVNRGDFLILSHREGRNVYRLKRWFPKIYLTLMARKTARLSKSK